MLDPYLIDDLLNVCLSSNNFEFCDHFLVKHGCKFEKPNCNLRVRIMYWLSAKPQGKLQMALRNSRFIQFESIVKLDMLALVLLTRNGDLLTRWINPLKTGIGNLNSEIGGANSLCGKILPTELFCFSKQTTEKSSQGLK